MMYICFYFLDIVLLDFFFFLNFAYHMRMTGEGYLYNTTKYPSCLIHIDLDLSYYIVHMPAVVLFM